MCVGFVMCVFVCGFYNVCVCGFYNVCVFVCVCVGFEMGVCMWVL